MLNSKFVACAFTLLTAGVLSAASISLDTAGADPILNTPIYSFMTDTNGHYFGTFTNASGMLFTRLDLTAQFSQAFYTGPNGPENVINSCSGGVYFNTCGVTKNDSTYTLDFFFYGLDTTHPGIPNGSSFPTSALLFQPSQTIGGNANQTTAMPEPASYLLLGAGLVLCGFIVKRKQLLELGVRA